MRLIIISHEPYRSYMRKDYFMDDFSDDGFDVTYWCVQKAIAYSSKTTYSTVEEAPGIVYINSRKDLLDRLAALDDQSLLCLEIWYNWDTIDIYRTISQKGLFSFSIDYFINAPESVNTKQKLKRSLQEGDYKKIIAAIRLRMDMKVFNWYTRLKAIQNVPLVFIPGERAKLLGAGKKTVSITHFDFERYQEALKAEPIAGIPEQYIVFLDDFLTNHPDIKRLQSSTLNEAVYYKKMSAFFDQVESYTGLSVIIAAHPKSNYAKEFGDRLCIKGKTSQLVIGSHSVIGHHSTSINYAVLTRKRVTLVFTNEFLKASKENYILKTVYDTMRGYELKLNCSVLNIDTDISLAALKPVDETRYRKFEQDYIFSEFFPMSNYDIIKEHVNKARIKS